MIPPDARTLHELIATILDRFADAFEKHPDLDPVVFLRATAEEMRNPS